MSKCCNAHILSSNDIQPTPGHGSRRDNISVFPFLKPARHNSEHVFRAPIRPPELFRRHSEMKLLGSDFKTALRDRLECSVFARRFDSQYRKMSLYTSEGRRTIRKRGTERECRYWRKCDISCSDSEYLASTAYFSARCGRYAGFRRVLLTASLHMFSLCVVHRVLQ